MPARLSDRIDVIEQVAEGQWGVFTEEQAAKAGVTRSMLTYHSRPEGRWEVVERSVFGIVGREPAWQAPLLAAQLCLGGGVPLTCRAAAAILGLDGVDRRTVTPELTLPLSRRHDRWRLHRCVIVPAELTSTGALVHTTPARTLVDLGTVCADDEVEVAVESALRLELVTEADLTALATSGRHGAPRLRRVLERRPPGSPPTESRLETVAIQVLRSCGSMPAPQRQVPVQVDGQQRFRLDLAWPAVRLYVEIDGRAWHDIDDESFHYERWRRRQLVALGWAPAELTAQDLFTHPAATTREVERLYRRRCAEIGSWRGLHGPK